MEGNFAARMVGRIDLLLQSSFIDSEEAREDFEEMRAMFADIVALGEPFDSDEDAE